jgi:hypothetical protein
VTGGSNRWERRIFSTANFEQTVHEREAFGWIYVKQATVSRTTKEAWYDVEMQRDTHHPRYATIVAQEARYFGVPTPKPVGGRAARLLHLYRKFGVALVPLVILALLQFVPPLEQRFQNATADWSENQLSLLALACIPLYIALVALTLKIQNMLEGPAHRRYQRELQAFTAIREDAVRKARTQEV